MTTDRFEPFRDLVASHRSASHPLFPRLIALAEAKRLTATAYRVFAANIAARTMLTLPEIHASCIQAALDLDPLRTAYGVMTGAEEGGFGHPAEVHTKLMMDALNNHGRVAFNLPPIDLKRLMAAVRLLFAAKQVASLAEMLDLSSRSIVTSLKSQGIFDLEGVLASCASLCSRYEIRHRGDDEEFGDLEVIGKQASRILANEGVISETIEYCLDQMALTSIQIPGYIQGVGFAHECLADGMIFNIFRVVYAGRNNYKSEDEFMQIVYPYFAAHGDYLAIVRGGVDKRDGVEAIHAQREFEKLGELDDQALAAAWQGAHDFADRNARIWDGLWETLSTG